MPDTHVLDGLDNNKRRKQKTRNLLLSVVFVPAQYFRREGRMEVAGLAVTQQGRLFVGARRCVEQLSYFGLRLP